MTPLNIPGIANGYKVDDAIWRGAQPEDGAWPLLAAAGAKSVLGLNNVGEAVAKERALVNGATMICIAMPWSGILPPSQPLLLETLGYLDRLPKPCFVHCQHGSDRTGTLCAVWRMFNDHWSFEDAIEEAFTSLGFNGLHEFWMAAAVAEYANANKS